MVAATRMLGAAMTAKQRTSSQDRDSSQDMADTNLQRRRECVIASTRPGSMKPCDNGNTRERERERERKRQRHKERKRLSKTARKTDR